MDAAVINLIWVWSGVCFGFALDCNPPALRDSLFHCGPLLLRGVGSSIVSMIVPIKKSNDLRRDHCSWMDDVVIPFRF